jgi:transposase
MKPPLFVGPLTDRDKQQLEAGLRSPDAFTLRRGQILLASARGYRPSQIAPILGCSVQSIRDAIRAFRAEGVGCLRAKPKAPKAVHAAWPKGRDDDLRALLHQSPRTFGKPTSLWTLPLAAQVCHEKGWTPRVLSGESIRRVLKRLGVGWKRAKHWMTSPDPNYAAKKARRDRLIRLAARHPDWVLGFEDEVWWSRLARPSLHAWTDGDPMKVKLLTTDEEDPDPDAIACYGFLRSDTHKVLLRFVEGRPLADLTIQFLDWVAWCVAKEGKGRLIVVWDDASWHTADTVARWVRQQNKAGQPGRGVPITICELPVASPWLNNIEPCFTHAKKAILDPDRKLTAAETVMRVCEHFGCELLPYLKNEPAIEG